jgi:hypothetical protein
MSAGKLNGANPVVHTVQRIAWAFFLIALPVTSFPFFPPAMGGEALVRPLSLYPLIILVFLVIIPRLIYRPIPRSLLPLIPFVLVAIASSLISLLRGIEPALGISVFSRVLRGTITLFIGCTIYLAVSLLSDTIEDLRFSLRWILAGGGLAMLWGSMQAIYVLHSVPDWYFFLAKIQNYVSMRRLLPDRISGLTYEPHWFSDQILLLILPWSLAAVLTGHSVFRWRWRWLTVEWLLLVWAILVLPFTFSRAGLLNMVVVIFFSILLLRPRKRPKTIAPSTKSNPLTKLKPNPSLKRTLEISAAVAVVILPIYLIGTRNLFFARIWEYWQGQDRSLAGYLQYLGFDARVTYSQAAFNTYKEYPLLGVGLGNYAFYFEEMLPNRPISEVPEALRMITPEKGRDRLITSKNFYLRLLAETGIVGAVTFLAFVIANLGSAIYLRLSEAEEWKYWGIASLCGIFAFCLSAFTFDSFVIPNMWIVFGMIAASMHVLAHSSQ